MTAEQIITLLRSHFCLLSLTENIKTEINNISKSGTDTQLPKSITTTGQQAASWFIKALYLCLQPLYGFATNTGQPGLLSISL